MVSAIRCLDLGYMLDADLGRIRLFDFYLRCGHKA